MQTDLELKNKIAEYRTKLGANPDSFCFAKLAELYLEAGLVDKALNTALGGLEKNPGYIAAQRVLALALHESGRKDNCRTVLEQLVIATPEDFEIQKILGRLYFEKGNYVAAEKVYKTLLDLAPDDAEAIAELENIRRHVDGNLEQLDDKAVVNSKLEPIASGLLFDASASQSVGVAEHEIIELSEDDIVEDDDLEEGEELESADKENAPFKTSTLAELYVQQGFISKALEIYHTILAENPKDSIAEKRIKELTSQADAAEEKNRSDHALSTFEGWLENLNKIKADNLAAGALKK